MGGASKANGFCVLKSHRLRQRYCQHRSRRNCPKTDRQTSSFQTRASVGFAHWEKCLFRGKKRGPDVLRALRIADHAPEARLHALRGKPDVPLGTIDGPAALVAGPGGEW